MPTTLAARVARPLQDLFLLGLRLYVSWQFLISGWEKLQDWDTTLVLFHEEYHTPVLPPDVAAVLGTFGEFAFPALLVIGLLTRYAALGLSLVNVMAVVLVRARAAGRRLRGGARTARAVGRHGRDTGGVRGGALVRWITA